MTIDFNTGPAQNTAQHAKHEGAVVEYSSFQSIAHLEWIEYLNTAVVPDDNKATYVKNFLYYPKLSLAMLTLGLASLIFLVLYILLDIRVIHPALSIWGVIAFGGMYGVLVSAAAEIENEKKQYL